MSKKIVSILIFIIILFASSCEKETKPVDTKAEYEVIEPENNIYKFIPKECKDRNNHIELIDEFNSEISIGYKNEDGTYTAYIFSSPIRYKEGSLNLVDIDNRLVKINSGRYYENNYQYRNNKGHTLSYFPENLNDNNKLLIENDLYELKISLKNQDLSSEFSKSFDSIWNVKNDTVIYSNNDYTLNSYATNTGIKTEIVLDKLPQDKTLDFSIDTPDLFKVINPGGYITFIDQARDENNRLQAVILPPIIKDSYQDKTNEQNPHMFLKSKLETESIGENKHLVSIVLDDDLYNTQNLEFPIIVDMSWDLHTRSQPDSPVYSKLMYTNQYLTDYSVIGNSEMFGDGENLSRLRIHEYIDDNLDNIKHAYFHTYDLSGFATNSTISLHKLTSFWASSEITWGNKLEPEYKVTEKIFEKEGYNKFDITELAKKALEDDSYNTESYGVLMKGDGTKNSYRILASSDHSLFSPFEEITFYEMPIEFNAYKK